MDNKAIIRQFYEEVVTHNQLDRIGDFISPDCITRIGNDTFPTGVNGM